MSKFPMVVHSLYEGDFSLLELRFLRDKLEEMIQARWQDDLFQTAAPDNAQAAVAEAEPPKPERYSVGEIFATMQQVAADLKAEAQAAVDVVDAEVVEDTPAAQTLAVDGAEFAGFGLIGQKAAYEWARISGLAPFEMFVAEVYPDCTNARDCIVRLVRDEESEEKLIAEYQDWFVNKGLWPSENPLGE